MGDVDWSDLWNINILANSNIWAENYFFFSRHPVRFSSFFSIAINKFMTNKFITNETVDWSSSLLRDLLLLESRRQVRVRRGSTSGSSLLFSGSVSCFLLPSFLPYLLLIWVSQALSPPPPPPPPPLLSPLPLKGTLLGPTACVTSWAGQSRWGMLLWVSMCLHLCICVCKGSPCTFFQGASPMKTHLKRYWLRHPYFYSSRVQTHRRTPSSLFSVILQLPSTAGSRERRWSRRLMDMFVYLFVLDMINWSAG